MPALIAEQFGISRSEARRLLEQGGVWLGEGQLGADDRSSTCPRRWRGAARRPAALPATASLLTGRTRSFRLEGRHYPAG